MWIKRILEALFPGEQLEVFLGMIGVWVLVVLHGAWRAKIWQRNGGSAVFLTKQKVQTLFSDEKEEDL